MKNLNQFYYSETQSSVKYISTQTGSLALNRLINAEPKFWIAPTLPSILKKKSLVLADWTACGWSDEKIEMVKRNLGILMDQGFSIYIWQDGAVISVDKVNVSTLDNQDIRQAMSLAYTQDITKAAVTQNKLTHNEVQVLDDYWLNYVLSDEMEPGERVLRTSDISSFLNKELILRTGSLTGHVF